MASVITPRAVCSLGHLGKRNEVGLIRVTLVSTGGKDVLSTTVGCDLEANFRKVGCAERRLGICVDSGDVL